MTAAFRAWWEQARWAILPQIHFHDNYPMEAVDGEAIAPGWLVTVEWLALVLQVSGGRLRSKEDFARLDRARLEKERPKQ